MGIKVEEKPTDVARAYNRPSPTQPYTGWPHACPSEGQMLRAGFIHSRESKYVDEVKCGSCGLALLGWSPNHDPAMEHLRRSPDYPRLQELLKG